MISLRIRTLFSQFWPLLLTLTVAVMVTGTVEYRAVTGTGGHLVYTLDDAYIHMAMARNLAMNGTFGINPGEFASASSSPLWTLLLALAYKIAGIRIWIPGALAMLFAAGSLILADAFCRRHGLGWLARLIAGLAVFHLAPLPTMVSTGMEHALHICTILAMILAWTIYAENGSSRTLIPLCAVSFLATAARYESLFLAAPLAGVLLLRRQWKPGFLMAVAAILPVVLFGLFSMANGSDFLPNSLLIKGRFHDIRGVSGFLDYIGGFALAHLITTPHLLSLGTGLLLVVAAAPRLPRNLVWLSAALSLSMLIHLQLARTGWFYRYEAYLVASAALVICVGASLWRRTVSWRPFTPATTFHVLGATGLVLLLAWPPHSRAKESFSRIPIAARNIYEQHYQMARFTAQHLPIGSGVAVHDLGAMAYYTQTRIVDIWGQASVELARISRLNAYNTAVLARVLTQGNAKYVMIYANWFQGARALPRELIPVGAWTITNNIVCGGDTVTFYGTTPADAQFLRDALRQFTQQLPSSVSWREVHPGDLAAPVPRSPPSHP